MTMHLLSRRQMLLAGSAFSLLPVHGAVAREAPVRPRVIVSSDIGGTDPDDFQSMVHLLISADSIDLEGIISSPWGPGRKQHILQVIDEYAKDFPSLLSYSPHYPSPDHLRKISKQGATESAGYHGYGAPTEGSKHITQCARSEDQRPLHILIWGGIDDLAQALHDAPEILPKLRVYFIGGPNKKFSADAYQYIADNHSKLWIVEANTTYRGWFVGGDQSGTLSNAVFVSANVANKGALGRYFAQFLGGSMKMGDTPSLAWLTGPNPGQPNGKNWGGSFVRAWKRSHVVFNRHSIASDQIEQFCIVEWRLPVGGTHLVPPTGSLAIDNQMIPGFWNGEALCFRCSPRDARTFSYTIHSDVVELEGTTGTFTAYAPPAHRADEPSDRWPNWLTDNPSPAFAEGEYQGAETVSRWRREFLNDFAERMARCVRPDLPRSPTQ